ncbi:uncharacterized protein LOC108427379 isoform X1 [Pygocentrus nattereri]|uniref:uncharacterized protein LOC108427379 isoform X1 n=2 Tax=Pygocentrus nattereri TaxID=42514 RepID=UPI0008143C47|nr:uncharacterized protein LOC108427379 isoform X1 [Pygocentrus nattereri]
MLCECGLANCVTVYLLGTQNHEDMSFDGYHVDGMSIKTWAYSTLLIGFHLSLGVCGGKCIEGSFKNHVTDNLLKDYLYRIKNFQQAFEQTKPEYTALSIFNMLCSSWLENKENYDTQNEVSGNHESSENNETKKDSRECLMHSYRWILGAYLGLDEDARSNITEHCQKHTCNFSYSTTDLTPEDFQSMYNKTCNWVGVFPACPSPQNTSSSTVQASTVTTTPVTTYQSTTTPSSTSTTNHQSINPSTPALTSTTSYQSINPSTPSPSSNVTSQRMREIKDLKEKNLVFTFLFIVSGLANVVLIIIVWSQCRRRHQNLQEPIEVPLPCDSAELVILNGNAECQ